MFLQVPGSSRQPAIDLQRNSWRVPLPYVDNWQAKGGQYKAVFFDRSDFYFLLVLFISHFSLLPFWSSQTPHQLPRLVHIPLGNCHFFAIKINRHQLYLALSSLQKWLLLI